MTRHERYDRHVLVSAVAAYRYRQFRSTSRRQRHRRHGCAGSMLGRSAPSPDAQSSGRGTGSHGHRGRSRTSRSTVPGTSSGIDDSASSSARSSRATGLPTSSPTTSPIRRFPLRRALPMGATRPRRPDTRAAQAAAVDRARRAEGGVEFKEAPVLSSERVRWPAIEVTGQPEAGRLSTCRASSGPGRTCTSTATSSSKTATRSPPRPTPTRSQARIESLGAATRSAIMPTREF